MTTIALVSLVCRLALAGVLTLSGITKLADRSGTRTALGAFGAPAKLAGPLAVVLPLVELTVAGLLVISATAIAGAVAAMILLAIFTAAIARTLARGETPDCHCFGQLHSKPAGRGTLIRNGVLMALAAIAIVGSAVEPAPSAVAWIGDLDVTQAALLAVAIALVGTLAIGGAAMLSLMRAYGSVLVRLERVEAALVNHGLDVGDDTEEQFQGLEPGTEAPWFLGTTSEGRGVSRDDLLTDEIPLLLLFTSPHCGPCEDLLPVAAEWQREHADTLTFAFASNADADSVRAEATKHGLVNVLVDESRAIADAFEASGTPSAVLVSADGTIRSWLAGGTEEIMSLVASATAPPAGLPIGAEPPSLELTTLEGDPFSLAQLEARETVLLFWNPGCGYCRAMHDDLLAFEERQDVSSPRLVVISSGEDDDTRADGFRSTVVLDAAYSAGTAFDAGGTPMAVLIGADGRVASEPVAGADAVLALLGIEAQKLAKGGAR